MDEFKPIDTRRVAAVVDVSRLAAMLGVEPRLLHVWTTRDAKLADAGKAAPDGSLVGRELGHMRGPIYALQDLDLDALRARAAEGQAHVISRKSPRTKRSPEVE